MVAGFRARITSIARGNGTIPRKPAKLASWLYERRDSFGRHQIEALYGVAKDIHFACRK
jgi:hypothetical protein